MAQEAKITRFTGTEVIDLTEAKDYLRVDHDDDDSLITELIKIARMQVFKDTNTVLVETTIEEKFNNWPSDNIIKFRYSGALSNSTVVYYNSENSEISLTDFTIVNDFGMPKIELNTTPELYKRIDPIKVSYTLTPRNADDTLYLKMAMYLLIGHYYDNRSAVTFGNPKELPIGYNRIISQYKNYVWQ